MSNELCGFETFKSIGSEINIKHIQLCIQANTSDNDPNHKKRILEFEECFYKGLVT